MNRSREGEGSPPDRAFVVQTAQRKVGRELRRILAQGRKMLLKLRLGQRWQPSEECFARRVYPSYETYLEHQRTKLDAFRERSIQAHDERFYSALSERLRESPISFQRRSVLCLAARQGTEVRAFIDAGAFAVGIDLNPGRENRYVVVGDFHDLQFSAGSVDVVYTNSLDHAFDLDRILAEVRRVLAAKGLLVLEVAEGDARGFYESLSWSSIDNLLERVLAAGFRLEHRRAFEVPWPGEQLLLRVQGSG